jgi:hypothetical protein
VNTPRSTPASPRAAKPLRVLLFSTLYPSSARPLHGIFVETRLRELLRHGQDQDRPMQARVVAPVPWYWSTDASHGKYAAMVNTPLRETRNGIDVRHPRFFTLPKIGMYTAPLMLALGARQALSDIRREGFDFDLIDAHYYYPDGVAAALLAHWFGKPLVVTARGSDVNLIPNHTVPRKFNGPRAARRPLSVCQPPWLNACASCSLTLAVCTPCAMAWTHNASVHGPLKKCALNWASAARPWC